nr:hypothetical protein [Candidatus Microthrix sp.]
MRSSTRPNATTSWPSPRQAGKTTVALTAASQYLAGTGVVG